MDTNMVSDAIDSCIKCGSSDIIHDDLDHGSDEEELRHCDNADEYITKLQTIITVTRDGKWQAMEASSRYRKKLQSVSTACLQMQKTTHFLRFMWTKLRDETIKGHKVLAEEMDTVVSRIQSKLQIHGSQMSISCEKCTHLQAMQIQVERLLLDVGKHKQLQTELSQEIKALGEKLRLKTEEVRKLQVQVRSREEIYQNNISKFTQDVKEKQELLAKQTKEMSQLHAMYTNQGNIEQDNVKKTSRSRREVEMMKSLLQKANTCLDKVRIERDDVKEQLESQERELAQYKTEMELLQREWNQIEGDFLTREELMQQAFNLKLDKEKEKLQELQQYVVEHRENEAKLMSHLKSTKEKHADKVKNLHRQLAEVTASNDRTREELQSELVKCKEMLAAGKAEMKETQNTHPPQSFICNECPKCKNNVLLKEELQQCKQKMAMLELTVEQECQERLELTHQLNKAQRQIVSLKRFQDSNTQGSRSTSQQKYSEPSNHSESLTLLQHAWRSSITGSTAPLSRAGFVDIGDLKKNQSMKTFDKIQPQGNMQSSFKQSSINHTNVSKDTNTKHLSTYGKEEVMSGETIRYPSRHRLSQSKKMLNNPTDFKSQHYTRIKDSLSSDREDPISTRTSLRYKDSTKRSMSYHLHVGKFPRKPVANPLPSLTKDLPRHEKEDRRIRDGLPDFQSKHKQE